MEFALGRAEDSRKDNAASIRHLTERPCETRTGAQPAARKSHAAWNGTAAQSLVRPGAVADYRGPGRGRDLRQRYRAGDRPRARGHVAAFAGAARPRPGRAVPKGNDDLL